MMGWRFVFLQIARAPKALATLQLNWKSVP